MKGINKKKLLQKILEQEHDNLIDRGECKGNCEDFGYCAFQRKLPEEGDKIVAEKAKNPKD